MTSAARRFAVVIVVAAASTAPFAVAQRQPATVPTRIPIEITSNHIIVKGRVNASRLLSFVLDTGASAAIMRMDVARELGLSLQGSVTGRGAGAGMQAGARVKDATWSLDGLERFSQPMALALPMPAMSSSLGREIDGVIGGEFIRQFVVELDYQQRSLTLHDRSTFTYGGTGEIVPIEFNNDGHPVVRATLTPVSRPPIAGRFLLDIGSGLALALHGPFVAEQHLPGPETKTIPAVGLAGIGGRSMGRLGRVTALQIGSFRVDDPIALFSEDNAGALADRSVQGNIGAQVVKRFRMFLDYSRRRIILERSSAFALPFDRAFTGIAVGAEGADYRTFRVREVLENSPATEAGIVEGDVITSIDGRPADTFTLSE